MPGSGNEPAELMAEREIVEPAIIKVQFTSVRHLSRVRYFDVRFGECCYFQIDCVHLYRAQSTHKSSPNISPFPPSLLKRFRNGRKGRPPLIIHASKP